MKNNSSFSLYKVLPVFLGFFIMGFVDVVGIATNYIKSDFALSDRVANLLPMMVFMWFFIFSIPSGLLMNKIGRRKTVIISFVIQILALVIPIFGYNFNLLLLAFALLGIGNTMLQVSLNPLLSNVVSESKLTSSLTLGQFIKAIASFTGPILAAFLMKSFGSWQLLFPVYAVVTILSSLWLMVTPIQESAIENKTSSFKECLSLLGKKEIFLLFLGILTVVGIDVGLNTTAPKIMQERTGMALESAGYATSLYFMFKTAGAFLGSIILSVFSAKRFYIISSVAAILALVGLSFVSGEYALYACIALAGFACANMFSIIFSFALKYLPEKSNEISGLMIMGVSGGAIFPWLMGIASDSVQAQTGAVVVLIVCCVYQLILSLYVKETK
ncbi:MAG: MFS transporter [Prevotella sp.]|jgi:fucose permease|nr:MFS transporter [Prevotella sp.]